MSMSQSEVAPCNIISLGFIREECRKFLGQCFGLLSDELTTQGIVSIPTLFDTATVDILSAEAEAIFSTRELDHNQHAQCGGAATEEFLEGCPGLSAALTHPLVWTLALCALGKDPYLAYLRAYRIAPIQPKLYRAFQPHIDGHGLELKAMILLSDVPAGGQSMRYWRGSHLIPWNICSSRDTIFTHEQVAQLGPPIECSGKAGSVFLFNTNGIHSGTRNATKKRDAIVLTINAGSSLYKIPVLNDQVREQVSISPYLRNILRVDAEKHIGESGPAPPEIDAYRLRYIRACSNDVVRDANRTLRLQHEVGNHSKNQVALKTSQLHELLSQTKAQPSKQLHNIPELSSLPQLDILQAVMEEDIARGIDLPIRISFPVRDPLRDTALCEVRDSWLHMRSSRKQFAYMLLTSVSNANIVCNRRSYVEAISQGAFLIGKVGRETGEMRAAYRVLLEDMIYCAERAETLSFLRTIFLLVLGTLEQIRRRGLVESENRWAASIDEIFTTLAYDYAALVSIANPHEFGATDLGEVLAK